MAWVMIFIVIGLQGQPVISTIDFRTEKACEMGRARILKYYGSMHLEARKNAVTETNPLLPARKYIAKIERVRTICVKR